MTSKRKNRRAAQPCRFCENPVAPGVKKCPRCGGKNPFPPSKNAGGGGAVLLLVIVGVAIWWVMAQSSSNTGRSSSGNSRAPAPAPNERPSSKQSGRPAVAAVIAIPTDVTYTIIDSEVVPGIKRSLDVRLSRKVSEEVLRAIALKLHSAEPRKFERTFIVYYLEGMQVGTGGWATTHFNPTLEVRILGLSIEDEERLAREPQAEEQIIIGQWVDEGLGGLMTVYRQNNAIYLEQRFSDGSSRKEALIDRRDSRGRRFDPVEGNAFGDHFIINSQGHLEIRDNDGLIRTARPR